MRKLFRPVIFAIGVASFFLIASVIASVRAGVEPPAPAALTTSIELPPEDAAEQHLEDATDQQLMNRGLIGEHHTQRQRRIAPPPGTEVYETVETATGGRQVMSRTTSWSEPLAGDLLWIEVTDFPSRQYQVSFWLLSGKSRGCDVFGRTMYSQDGRRLKSEFWRNDRDLRITGAAEFPADLYPSAVPASALPRAVASFHDGAQGTVSQQITPYGYVDLKVRVENSGPLSVPAGKFSACKVSSQPDVAKLLPNWPHMLLHVVTPFIPETTYYFQCQPPYRFLKKEQQGSPFVGGPEATTELVRYYKAGKAAPALGGAGRGLAAPKAAAG